jgi:RNA polymerase sigma factor (sigma-70 family)
MPPHERMPLSMPAPASTRPWKRPAEAGSHRNGATPDGSEIRSAPARSDRTGLTQAVVREHSDRLYAYCRRLTGDDDRALDLMQETWLRSLRYGVPTVMPCEVIFRWLASVALRAFLNRLKRERRYVPLLPSHDRGLPNCDPARCFEEAEQAEHDAQVLALAKDLDPLAYLILTMRLGDPQLKWDQVAKKLGLSDRTARRRLEDLKGRLRARRGEGGD